MVRDLKRNYRKVTCRADLGEYKVELVTSFVGRERVRESKRRRQVLTSLSGSHLQSSGGHLIPPRIPSEDMVGSRTHSWH